MQCINPVFIPEQRIWAPCRKCRMCKIARSREWSLRMMHEMNYHESNCFATLTYSDEKLPKDQSISKEELQRFFKRLRKSLGDRKLKYYACGEYGEQYGRPHYHAILFGVGLSEHKMRGKMCLSGPVKDAWNLGFVHLGTVTGDSTKYVSDYMHKSYNGEMENYYQGRLQPFQVQSQGLGKNYAIDNAEQLMHNLGCTVKGYEVGLPRYYQKKLLTDEFNKLRFVEKAKRNNEDLVEYWTKKGVEEEEVFVKAWRAREQRSKTVSARVDMKKRKL